MIYLRYFNCIQHDFHSYTWKRNKCLRTMMSNMLLLGDVSWNQTINQMQDGKLRDRRFSTSAESTQRLQALSEEVEICTGWFLLFTLTSSLGFLFLFSNSSYIPVINLLPNLIFQLKQLGTCFDSCVSRIHIAQLLSRRSLWCEIKDKNPAIRQLLKNR